MNEKSQSITRGFHPQGSDDPLSSEAPARRPKSGAVHDVLADRQLTIAEKRAVLASWASDAHAVADMPSMRRLEDGEVVKIDEILEALKAIDGHDDPRAAIRTASRRRQPCARREPRAGIGWPSRISTRKNSDGDDPPPRPAAVGCPRRASLVDARSPMPAWGRAGRCSTPVAA